MRDGQDDAVASGLASAAEKDQAFDRLRIDVLSIFQHFEMEMRARARARIAHRADHLSRLYLLSQHHLYPVKVPQAQNNIVVDRELHHPAIFCSGPGERNYGIRRRPHRGIQFLSEIDARVEHCGVCKRIGTVSESGCATR